MSYYRLNYNLNDFIFYACITNIREENQRLSAELQKYLAVESLSKEEPSEISTQDHDEQIN